MLKPTPAKGSAKEGAFLQKNGVILPSTRIRIFGTMMTLKVSGFSHSYLKERMTADIQYMENEEDLPEPIGIFFKTNLGIICSH